MAQIRVFAGTRILVAMFVILFLVFTINIFFDAENSTENRSRLLKNKECSPWRKWMKSVKRCILDGIQTSSAWYMLDKIIDDCVDKEKLRSLNIRVLTNIDDTKLAIMDLEAKTPCTSITFGIGNNIHGEQALSNAMPQCKFYGADPIKSSGNIFKQIGQYDSIAVGTETWFANATIKINSTIYMVEMPVVNFVDYMTNTVNKSSVDFLFMNMAGFEYRLLTTFFKSKVLDRITICQITVQLHGPPGQYNMTKMEYDNFAYNFIKYSPFIPLWSKTNDRHTKVFFFNSNNKYCVEKYVLHMC